MISIEISGIDSNELQDLRMVLGNEIKISRPNNLRSGMEFLDAVFVLGVLKTTPQIITSIGDILLKIQEKKYISYKIKSEDEGILIEGKADEELIEKTVNKLNKLIKGS